ncbi:signal peptidase II [Qingshengfaniella alkalisoli]|uniref:Lipoprotein signal peptidase n=1 Tax=Qingshengfaniella alkalisoli TaxID=2599296 RepID=A0A5B8I9Y7_9RHOB|nr:signal peptidase II [Qingshengfaniella alkalisoli]QDY69936.1 signal peptidase II [Qingshengfaniella alkalisoli]
MRAFVLSAIGMFALDQGSKWFVVHALNLKNILALDVWPPFLRFRMGWNEGINFGLLSGHPDAMRWLLIAVAIAISVWVSRWALKDGRLMMQVSAGLLVGGALGNVLDRLLYGAVADFLNMSCCGINNPYTFNVADIGVFAGAIGLVLFSGQKKTP